MSKVELLTTAEVAAALDAPRREVLRMVASGALVPVHRLPGKTGALLFTPESVDALSAKETAS